MNHLRSAAPAALATAWPFNSTLSRRIGRAKTLWLTAYFLLATLSAQAAPPLKVWNGSASTNWATPANWTPAVVPIAGDSVRVPSAPANQPIILSGTMAKAKNVLVLSGATLTINTGGELELASTLNVSGLMLDDGTVINSGLIKVKSGFQGIDVGGSFTNNGTIRLGEATSSPYAFTEEGIRVIETGDNFTNNSTGNIIILRPGNNGVLLFLDGGSFTNHGKITVREAGLNPATAETADGIDARDGDFVNETTGDIVVSKITANGLNCRRTGSWTNKGKVKVGNVGLTAALAIREGINNSAFFVNTSTGEITIDTCSNNGILNNAGTFHNYGQISVGTSKANSITNNGLVSLGVFNNYGGATLTIKNAKTGILGGGLGGTLTNYSSATITIDQVVEDGIYQFGLGGTDNRGTLSIGSTGSVGRYGINNACQFLNQFGATLSISSAANNAILNTSQSGLDGMFKNGGTISLNNALNVGGAAISNTVGCTFENLSCGSLIRITSNNAISNAGTFTNEGNIIENASGNSSVTTNSGTIQNLNGGTFTVTGSNTGVNSTDAGVIWTGCDNTNWANLYNWNGLAVPLASQDVIILSSSNDPTIFGGTAAVAKSVTVKHSAELTLNTSSNLTISGSTAIGLYNGSTVNNAGTLSISNTGGVGFHNNNTLIGYEQNGTPIYGGGIFNNNSGGLLTINNTAGDGIFQGGASLNNFAQIKVGNTGNIGGFGIQLRGSGLDNKAGGDITIDRTTSDGIFIFNYAMTNAGKITIGGIAGTTIGGAGILNGATVNNNEGGEILIDRSTQAGVSNSFAIFHNSGMLKIGSTANIGYYGIGCQRATFNNYSTGEVNIDRTGLSGIYNYYGSSSRAINNSGKITIGQTAAIGGEGIANDAIFNNNADGEITIDRTANNGIYVRDDNDSNTSPASFSNSGKITIGGTATIGSNGIRNRVTFNNNAGGDIQIDRTTGDGLQNFQGTFSNAAKITIGATTTPTEDGLDNAATFNNQACGEIALHDNLQNSGTFTNTGLLRMNTALAHTNSSTFTNDGIIEYPQGSLIPSVTNNDLIVKAVSGECPVANALQVGGSNSFTVGTTWYKNQNLTMPAGTYDAGANAFSTNGLAEGSTTTLYFTVSDGTNGCTRTVSIRLTYDDVTRPTIACPPSTTLYTQDDGGADCAVTLTYSATFSDNCDGTGPATKVSGPASGTSLNVNGSPYTVVHTYTDMGGNTVASNCTFSVTVKDNTQPTFTCPTPPLTLYTTGAANCLVSIPNLVDMVSDEADNCALRSSNPVTQSVAAGPLSAMHGQSIPITVTVWDNASPANSTACTLTFTVSDNDAPSITCPANIVRNTDASQCSAIVTYGVTGSDNCTYTLTRTAGQASGTVFNKGTHNVEWKAEDAAANMSNCVFTVTVNDTQLPSITCPANLVRSTDAGQCTAVVTYTNPTYSDNCLLDGPAGLDHISGGTSGTAFPKGTTAVIWQATDGSNNTRRCTFTVTVNDTQLPGIVCPANQTRSTDLDQCQATVTYATPTASDNCALPNGQPVWLSGGTAPTPSGSNSVSVFQKGQTTVTWRATDAVGLTKTCSFRVTINDTQLPGIACPSSQSLSTDPNLCSAVASYTTPTATDNCTPLPTVVKTSGLASGSAFPKGANTVVWKATDGAGLMKTCSFTVTVTDVQLPAISCPQNISVTGSGSPCTAMATYATPTATDNCAVQSVLLLSGLGSGSQFPAGVTTVVWRAIDNSGLSATCAFAVTVSCQTSGPSQTYGPSQPPQRGGNVTAERDIESAIGRSEGGYLVSPPSEGTGEASPPLRGGWEGPYLLLAPNPATDQVQISVEGLGKTGGDLTVLDAQGKLMWQQQLSSPTPQQVSVADFPEGLYFVTLRSEGGVVTKRLVVAHH